MREFYQGINMSIAEAADLFRRERVAEELARTPEWDVERIDYINGQFLSTELRAICRVLFDGNIGDGPEALVRLFAHRRSLEIVPRTGRPPEPSTIERQANVLVAMIRRVLRVLGRPEDDVALDRRFVLGVLSGRPAQLRIRADHRLSIACERVAGGARAVWRQVADVVRRKR